MARKQMGPLAKTATGLLLAGAVWAAVTGTWVLTVLLVVLAGSFPLAEYVVGKDRDLREAGSDYKAPPAGIGGRSDGGGGA